MGLLDIGINIIESILYAALMADYLELKREKKQLFLLTYTIIGAVEITIFNYFYVYEGLLTVIMVAILYLVMYFFRENEKDRPINLLIYAIVLDIAISVGNEAVFLISYWMNGFEPLETIYTISIVYRFLGGRCVLLLIMLVINKYTKKYRTLQTKYDWIFACGFSILLVVTTIIESMIIDGDRFVMLIFINFFLFFLTALLYIVFYHAQYDHFLEMQRKSFEMEMETLKNNAQAFREKEEAVRIMRHDLKNQLTIVKNYLDQGKTDKINEYIQKNVSILDHVPVSTNTGYTAIDAIVSNKINSAKEKDISIQTMIQIGNLSSDAEYDIAMVLANLLDNAIENISRLNRDIRVVITHNDQLKIEVSNSTDMKNVNLKTGKTDSRNHGIGLNSVKIITEKYNGQLYIDIMDNRFYATVILNDISHMH